MALGKNKILFGLLGLIIISIVIIGFYVKDFTKNNISQTLIKEQTEIQMVITKSLAASVNYEFQGLLMDMKTISESTQVQQSLTDKDTINYIFSRWDDINSLTKISDIFLVDKSLTVVSQVNDEKFRLVGLNLQNIQSSDEFMIKPGYSGEIISSDGIYRVLVSSPIRDSISGEFIGIVFAIVEPSEIISKYIGIYEVELSSIEIFDENQKFLFSKNKDLLGKEFTGYFSQTYYGENELQNSHYQNIFSGNTKSFVYENHRVGEVISTGTPISIEEKNRFFFIVTTPVKYILEDIERNLFVEDLKNNLILFIITVLFAVIILKRSKSIENEKLQIIGQLASNIAHDIRNPLGIIRSSITRIEKQENENEIINQETERIKRSVARMNHQIEGVLNYVRTTPLNVSENSLNDLIKSGSNSLSIPKNIKLEIPKKDIAIYCDSDKFKVVIENLLLNAIQSINTEEGKIIVKAEEDEKEITVSFENSGPNISEESLSKIFMPLYTSKLKGTGLGLSSCYNIISQHKGTIYVTNSPVTFTIKIPKNLRKEDKLD